MEYSTEIKDYILHRGQNVRNIIQKLRIKVQKVRTKVQKVRIRVQKVRIIVEKGRIIERKEKENYCCESELAESETGWYKLWWSESC